MIFYARSNPGAWVIRHIPSSTARTPPLVAAPGARVGEGLARDGDEPPVVAAGFERELQNPRSVRDPRLAVGLDRAERTLLCSSGADHELPYAPTWIAGAVGPLWGKALLVVVVAVHDHVCVRPVERLPGGRHLGLVAVLAGAEERVVEVGQRAPLVRIGGQVLLEPADHG